MNSQDIWEEILRGTPHLERRPQYHFDPAFYRRVYADMREADAIDRHYERYGREEGRIGTLYQSVVREAPEIDERLGLLVRHPALKAALEARVEGAHELAFELIALGDPVDHTISDFSARHYLRIYEDLSGSQINAFVHYIKFGLVEGRRSLSQLRRNRAVGQRAHDPNKPTCVIGTHEMSGTGAPRVALQLAESACASHNVIVVALRSGKLLAPFREHATLVLWSERPSDELDYIDALAFDDVDFAVLNSVECFPFVRYLVGRDIPFASYIHEFTEYSLPHYKNLHTALFTDRLFLSSHAIHRSWRPVIADLDVDFVPREHIMPQSKFEVGATRQKDFRKSREALSRILGIDCTDKKIVYGAGEAQWRKGTDIFFMLAIQCRTTHPDTIFVWIGDGVNHEDFHFGVWLEKHMQEAGVSAPGGNAFYLPAGPSYFDVCRAADILFLSSRFDPLPNVVFDAAKAGCAVVIFEGGSGFDDPSYLATGLVRRVRHGDLGETAAAIAALPAKSVAGGMAAVRPEAGETAPAPAGFVDVAADGVFDAIAAGLKATLAAAPALPEEADGDYDVSLLFDKTDDPALRRIERRKIFRYGRLGVWPNRETAEQRLAASGNFVHRTIRIAAFSRLSPLRHAPFSIHVHAYYADGLEADLANQIAFREAERVLVTTDTEDKAEAMADFGRKSGIALDIRLVENRGRDILPFIALADDDTLVGPDDLWCHVHLKQSLAIGLGERADHWRRFLMRILLGDDTALSSALALIARPHVGLVGAFDPYVMGWTGSHRLLPSVAPFFPEPLPAHPLVFPMGNMFWARGHVMRSMRALFGPDYPYPNEPIPNDGTVFHLMERLWPAIAAREGLESVFLDKPDERRS